MKWSLTILVIVSVFYFGHSQTFIENSSILPRDSFNFQIADNGSILLAIKSDLYTGYCIEKSNRKIILTPYKNGKINGYKLEYKKKRKNWVLVKVSNWQEFSPLSTWRFREFFTDKDTVNYIKSENAVLKQVINDSLDKSLKAIEYDFGKNRTTEYRYNWLSERKFKYSSHQNIDKENIDYSNSKLPFIPGVVNQELDFFSFIRYDGSYLRKEYFENDTLQYEIDIEFRFNSDKTLLITKHLVQNYQTEKIDTTQTFVYQLKEKIFSYKNQFIKENDQRVNINFEPYGIFVEFDRVNPILGLPSRVYMTFKKD